MNYYEKIYEHVISLQEDFEKFYNRDNKAAGTRIRKGMQDLKNLAQEIRLDVQNRKNEN